MFLFSLDKTLTVTVVKTWRQPGNSMSASNSSTCPLCRSANLALIIPRASSADPTDYPSSSSTNRSRSPTRPSSGLEYSPASPRYPDPASPAYSPAVSPPHIILISVEQCIPVPAAPYAFSYGLIIKSIHIISAALLRTVRPALFTVRSALNTFRTPHLTLQTALQGPLPD